MQAALILVAPAVAVWVTRRHRDARLLVLGTGLVFLALIGLRAAH